MIIASLFEKRAAGLYHNTAAVIDADGSLLGIYRKMHIPDDPLFYEKFYFTPGDTGFRAWKTKHATIGVLICWDQWFPEGARLTALQGAEILFYPTAIGWHPREKKQYGAGAARVVGADPAQPRRRQRLLRVRAQPHRPRDRHGPNGKPVNADGIEFWGQSFVASPDGQVVKRAPSRARKGARRRLRPRDASSSAARTGRSCAIAGSTPTAT